MADFSTTHDSISVVGLGEVLFDRFANGRIVLGGAPLNLAVHAHQLLQSRGSGVPVSSVGDDDLGKKILAEISERGMTTQYISASSYPTGMVQVEVDDQGRPSYEITENVAWDHLEFSEAWGELAPRCSAVCFGTLAQRSPESREAIQKFLTNAPQALKVCDLNLRQHFYSADLIRDCLQLADVLKLNEEELTTVSKALDMETIERSSQDRVDQLIELFNLKLVVLTRGKLGTTLTTAKEFVEGEIPTYHRHPNADDVGAGDACCAAIIVGLLLKKPLDEIVNLANQAGAYVASQPGATPRLSTEILQYI